VRRGSPGLLFLLFVALFASSCASLTSYSRMTDQARLSLAQGSFPDALTLFPETSARGRNAVLIRLERGILLQGMGRYEDSARELEDAAARIRQFEDRAVISASKTADQVGSLLINEQIRPYEGEDFEKILIHAFDAVNYLMRGDLEGARVEIRNAYTRQTELYQKHEKALTKAREDNPGLSWEDSFQKADKARYEEFRKKSGDVRNIYQNAFAYYLSSLVYELGGEEDEAYIDLKKGLEAAPWSKDIQRDLIRLSKKLNLPEDIEKFEAAYGKGDTDYGKGIDVFLIFQQGVAPVKEELSFPIPLSQGGLVFASLPVYRFVPSPDRAGLISFGSVSRETSTLYDIDAVASKNLLDRFPILFAKQVARSYLKGRLTNSLSREYGTAGAIGGTLAALITERADLRTWSMLPKEIQVARVFVPEGTRTLGIRSVSTGRSAEVEIPEKARHVVVLCRATDAGLHLQTKAY
jgi:uncharacterized protein